MFLWRFDTAAKEGAFKIGPRAVSLTIEGDSELCSVSVSGFMIPLRN